MKPNVRNFAYKFLKKNKIVMQNTDNQLQRKLLRDALEAAHYYIGNECKKTGVSVAELCRVAGVERSHFQRWKTRTPRSIKTFNRLMAALDHLDEVAENEPNHV